MNNAAHNSNTPLPLLSATARFGIAVAVATLACVTWITAERASTQAVQTDVQAFTPARTYVTLPPVEIVGHSQGATAKTAATASVSCNNNA